MKPTKSYDSVSATIKQRSGVGADVDADERLTVLVGSGTATVTRSQSVNGIVEYR